jgi:hypothetical protein
MSGNHDDDPNVFAPEDKWMQDRRASGPRTQVLGTGRGVVVSGSAGSADQHEVTVVVYSSHAVHSGQVVVVVDKLVVVAETAVVQYCCRDGSGAVMLAADKDCCSL